MTKRKLLSKQDYLKTVDNSALDLIETYPDASNYAEMCSDIGKGYDDSSPEIYYLKAQGILYPQDRFANDIYSAICDRLYKK